jgi:hypothetical protein
MFAVITQYHLTFITGSGSVQAQARGLRVCRKKPADLRTRLRLNYMPDLTSYDVACYYHDAGPYR